MRKLALLKELQDTMHTIDAADNDMQYIVYEIAHLRIGIPYDKIEEFESATSDVDMQAIMEVVDRLEGIVL